MFSKALLGLALAAAGADAFMGGAPLPALRNSRAAITSNLNRVRMQQEDSAKPPVKDGDVEVKSVATGGTDYSKVPKKEITPLFIIPASSVVGDGSMVGDKGFDPLGLATSMTKLKNYREAELKHCRLAMLAALGWPMAEALQGPLSKALGAPDLLVAGEKCANNYECAETLSRVPSVLNGGLDQISPFYWGAVIALSGAIEFYGQKIQRKANYLPGDLGFDPLGLYQKLDPAGKQDMQLKELNNGRLAMIAITGYAFNEAATKASVVSTLGVPQ